MLSLDSFIESLIQEKEKFVQMGVHQTSKNQALLVIDSTNVESKGKHKGKEPKASDSKPKESHRYFEGALGFERKKKLKKIRCPYYMRVFILKTIV